jgi:hypothetical protein
MKISNLTLPAATVSALAIGQIAFGIVYVSTCELRAKVSGQCEPQWQTAQALFFGGGATGLGLNTINPWLQPPAPKRRRDENGRFSPEGDPQ